MNEKSFIYWNGKLAILYIRTYLELNEKRLLHKTVHLT